MSRTRKRSPREFYKGTKVYMTCPRHGYCSYCDRGRTHKFTTAEYDAEEEILEAYTTDVAAP